jgi:mRNA interferase YafQ
MLNVIYTVKYKKSLDKYLRIKKFSLVKLEGVILKLQNQIILDKKYMDHPLKGKLSNHRECHIYPDILLVYRIV